MKIRPNPWKTLLILGIVLLLGAGMIFGMSFKLFLKPIQEWGWQPYVIAGLYLAFAIVILILSYLFSYYEVFKKYVSVTKGGKKLIYYYSDVVYIDEKQYKKGRLIAFYTKQGDVRYLLGDKKDILFQAMMKNSPNRLNEEEFKNKYPQVKL